MDFCREENTSPNPPDDPAFPLERASRDGILVLRVAERMVIAASRAEEFLRAVLGAAPSEAPRVVLDVSRVDFFEADGVDALLALHDRLDARGGSLAIVGVNRVTTQVFRLAGLDAVFRLFGTEGAAVLGVLQPRVGGQLWH